MTLPVRALRAVVLTAVATTLLQTQPAACAVVEIPVVQPTTTTTTTMSPEQELENSIVDLYNCSRSDGLWCLNNANFRHQLVMKPYAWLIQFYNSWCGHCQLYAPTWIKFAHRVRDWSNVVRVGAINCARSANVPVCRDYEVGAYPWVKLFPPLSKADTQGVYLKHGNVKKMTALVVDELTKLQESHRPANWPSLAVSSDSVSDLTRRPAQVHVAVLEDSADSQLGRQLILDLSRWRSSLLVRRSTAPPVDLPAQYTSLPRPLVVVFRNGVSSVLHPPATADDMVQQLDYYRLSLLNMTGLEVTAAPTLTEIAITQRPVRVVGTPAAESDRGVSPSDLEKAVQYAINNEVLGRREFSREAVEALSQFLRLLQQHLPNQRVQMSTALQRLRALVDSAPPSVGGEWLQQRMAAEGVKIPGSGVQWKHCRGSEQRYRGYTCSLWMLFHSVTVNKAITEPNGISPLPAILGYVRHFFSCRECSQNFQRMADEDGLLAVSTAKSAAIWLWKAHNKVNKRLKNTLTEDPQHPKVQFPSEQQCAECRDVSGRFNHTHVLRFLQVFYLVPSSHGSVVEAPLPNLRQQHHLVLEPSSPMTVSRRVAAIASDDVSLCVLLWLFGAITLLVAWQLIRLRRKRSRRANLSWKTNH